MVNFPSSLDTLLNPASDQYTDDPGFELDLVVSDLQDIAMALEAKIGVVASTPTARSILAGISTGGSAYLPADSLVFPNLIVDAAMNIWPDGTPLSSVANNTWGPAGFVYGKAGTVAVHDMIRSTDVPAVAATIPHSLYSTHLDVTTADASIAAGDLCALQTRIEGYSFQQLAQRQFSLGFWVKAAKTGVHCVAAQNSASDRSCVMEYTVNVADTWEYKTVTFPASPSAGTWDYTNGRGIQLAWTLAGGSTFQTAAGAWATGSFFGTSNQVNELDSTSNNFKLALVGPPTPGAYAAPFTCAPYLLELLRACRYYVRYAPGGLGPIFGFGQAYSAAMAAGAAVVTVPLPVPMRAAPTLAISSAAHFYTSTAGFGNNDCTGATFSIYNANAWPKPGAEIQITSMTGTGMAQGQNTFLYPQSASAELKFSARIP